MLSLKGRRGNNDQGNGHQHHPMLNPMVKLNSVRRRRAAAAAAVIGRGAEGTSRKLSSREEAEQAQLSVKDELAVTQERQPRKDTDFFDLIERQEELLAHREEKHRRLKQKLRPQDPKQVPSLDEEEEDGEEVFMSTNDQDCYDETTETPLYDEKGVSGEGDKDGRRIAMSCSTDDDKENENDSCAKSAGDGPESKEDLWNVIDGYRDNIEALSKRNKRLETRLKKMPKEIETACQQVLSAIQKMSEQQRTITTLTTENESLKRKVSALEEKDAATSKELALLKEHILRRHHKEEKRRMARSRERRPHCSDKSPLPMSRKKAADSGAAAPPRRCSSADAASARRRRSSKASEKRADSDGETEVSKPSQAPVYAPAETTEPETDAPPEEPLQEESTPFAAAAAAAVDDDHCDDHKDNNNTNTNNHHHHHHELTEVRQDEEKVLDRAMQSPTPPPPPQPVSRTSSFKLWPPSPKPKLDMEHDDDDDDDDRMLSGKMVDDDDAPTLPSSEELQGGARDFLQIQDITLPGQSLLHHPPDDHGAISNPLRRTERRLRARSQRDLGRKKMKEQQPRESPTRRRQRDPTAGDKVSRRRGGGGGKDALQSGGLNASRRSMLMRRRKTPPRQRTAAATASSSSDNGPNPSNGETHES